MEGKKEINAGIIGSGFAAGFHLEALKRVYGIRVNIVGVYSRNPDNMQVFSNKYDVTGFHNLEKLIESCAPT